MVEVVKVPKEVKVFMVDKVVAMHDDEFYFVCLERTYIKQFINKFKLILEHF